MKRRVLNLVTLVSLLLCVAVVATWVAGVRMRPSLTRYHAHGLGATSVYANPDGVYFWKDDSRYFVPDGGGWSTRLVLVDREVTGVLGFGVGREDPMFYTNGRYLRVPYWFLIVVTAVVPGLQVVRWRRRRRYGQRGLCRRCGYDLTGNVSGVCPECGQHPVRRW